jgi:predicted oxidoreductase
MQIELLKKYVRQSIVINQLELNVLHNGLINDGIVANTTQAVYTGAQDMLDYCRLNDIMIQAWSPVAQGAIFNPPDNAPENVKQTAAEIVKLAQKYNTNPTAIALAWILRHPAKIQPIIGTMKVERIAESAAADNLELSREDWFGLLAAANGAGVP